MRKMLLYFAILFMLCVSLTGGALAEAVQLPPAESDGYFDESAGAYRSILSNYYLLCDGDTTHFLLVREEGVHGKNAVITYSAACFSINEQDEVDACPSHCGDVFAQIPPFDYDGSLGRPYFLVRSPQNKTYLFDTEGHVLQWQPDSSPAWKPLATLNFSGLDTGLTFQNTSGDIISFVYAVNGETLYASFKSPGDGYTIQAFNLTDGSRQEVGRVGNIHGLTAAQEGTLLSCCSPKTTGGLPYYLIDCETGELTQFVLGLRELYSSDFVFDRQDGWYYATQSGNIRYLDAQGEESIVASFPLSGQMNRVDFAISENGSQAVMLITDHMDNTACFRRVDLQPQTSSSLVFDGQTAAMHAGFGTLPSFSDFALENGQAQAELHESLSDAHDISQALLTQSDAYDILITHINVMDFDSLFEKGYYVDLSDRAEISSYFDSLYPVWREACTWQNSIAAFPVQADDTYQFMYNTELFADLQLEVPRSYSELFLFIRQWMDDGILDEYPLFEINGINKRSFEHLFFKLLGDYILLCEADGTLPDFQDPELKEALAQLEALRELLDQHDALNLTGTPLLTFTGGVTAVNFEHTYDVYGRYEPLVIGYGEENRPVMQANLLVMLINPYSKNVDLAKDYLAFLAENPTAVAQCVFQQGAPEGVETEGSIKARTSWVEKVSKAAQKLEDAKGSGDADAIQAAEAEWNAIAADEPETAWSITPDNAGKLYQVLPYAQVRAYQPFGVIMENGERELERYLTGQIGVDELLRNLRAMMLMIEAE